MIGGGFDLIKLWCSGYQNCTTFIRVKTWVLRRITSCSMCQRFTKLRTSVYNPNCRSSHKRCSIIKGVLRIFAKLIGKTPVPESLFQASNFIKKENLAQVFSCELCEISKNAFFTGHLRTTASATETVANLLLAK